MSNDRRSSLLPLIIIAVVVLLILSGSLRTCSAGGSDLSVFVGSVLKFVLIAAIVVILLVAGITVLIILLVHKDDNKIAKAKSAAAEGKTDQLVTVLNSYRGKYGIGKIADTAAGQMSNLNKTAPLLTKLLGEKFDEGSMTYERFAAPIATSIDTVRQNTLVLAKLLEGFDADDYRKLSKIVESGEYTRDVIDDEVQLERYRIYRNNLNEMERIIGTNERMLLVIDQISSELSKLKTNEIGEKGARIAEEIEELARTAKYYQSKL